MVNIRSIRVDVQRLAEMAPRHGVQASEMWDVSDGIAIEMFIICCSYVYYNIIIYMYISYYYILLYMTINAINADEAGLFHWRGIHGNPFHA